MALGFAFMVFGMLGYVGSVLFSLTTHDIDGLRLVTLITLLSVMSFMLGSILEIRDLSYSKDVDIPTSDQSLRRMKK